MQIDLGQVEVVGGIIIQGAPHADDYVTRYVVAYKESEEDSSWTKVDSEFQGGPSPDNERFHSHFPSDVHARLIRIYPKEWNSQMAMRAGVLVGGTRVASCNPQHMVCPIPPNAIAGNYVIKGYTD